MLRDLLPPAVQAMIEEYENALRELAKEHFAPFGEARARWDDANEQFNREAAAARARTQRGIDRYFVDNPDADKEKADTALEFCFKTAERRVIEWYGQQVWRARSGGD